MAKDSQASSLKTLGISALIFVSIAIISVLGIIVLAQFKGSVAGQASANTTIDAWIAAIVVFGTFATIIALVLVTKVIIGVVKGLQ